MSASHKNIKFIKRLTALAESQGWRVLPTRNGHYKFFAPDGVHLVVIGVPDHYRDERNAISELRRGGLNV